MLNHFWDPLLINFITDFSDLLSNNQIVKTSQLGTCKFTTIFLMMNAVRAVGRELNAAAPSGMFYSKFCDAIHSTYFFFGIIVLKSLLGSTSRK